MIVDPDTPQPKPLTGMPVPGIKTSDQIVSEIHGAMANLPPEHQAALDHGISMLNGNPSPPASSAAPPAPQPAASPISSPPDITQPDPVAPAADASALPGMVNVTPNDIAANQPEIALPSGRSISGRMSTLESPKMIAPRMGSYEPLPSPPSAAATELKRLRDTGSGVSQIHNPFLKTLGTVADVVGSGFFPQFAQFVPGSTAHHEQLIAGRESQVGDEQKQRKLDEEAQKTADSMETAEANRKHLQAESEELASRPELKKAQNDLKAEHEENERRRNADAADASLRQHGFKRDEKTGQIVALSPEELSGPQRDIHDAKVAQQDLMSARAELVKAQQAHIPAAEALARRRLDSAQASHDIALERLGLSEKTFEARYHGTEGGQALPGAMIADNGQTVGTAFQQNVRPTGAERNKADLANSAAEQISDIKSIVKKRHDIFGPLNGRTTDFSVWLGSQDPDAQRFRAARTIAADHLAGVFGGRSETALHALDNAIGQFKDNPEAVEAGLDQVVKGNEVFQKAGTVKTAGSGAVAVKDAPQTITTKAQYDALPKGAVYMEDGQKYRKP